MKLGVKGSTPTILYTPYSYVFHSDITSSQYWRIVQFCQGGHAPPKLFRGDTPCSLESQRLYSMLPGDWKQNCTYSFSVA